MSKPTFNPSFRWAIQTTGQMTSEAQRLLRQLLDIVWARTGLETSKVVTGTAGTTGQLGIWDANGDINGTATAAGIATFLGTPSSANLLAALTDETGTGKAVFATAPTFTTSITIGGAAIGFLDFGTYTPTLSNTTNVAASTAQVCQYALLGGICFVSGTFAVDPTAAGANTVLGISLPVPSNLSAAGQLAGTGSNLNSVQEAWGIIGDATNDIALAECFAGNAANHTVTFSFMYRVI